MKVKYVKDGSGIFSNYLRMIDWLWLKDYIDFDLEIDWNHDNIDLLDSIIDVKLQKTSISPDLCTSNWVEQEVNKLSVEKHPGLAARRSSIPFYNDFRINDCVGYFYTTPEIYFHKDFSTLRKEFNKIIGKYIEINDDFIRQHTLFNTKNKTLAVHLRYPGHYCYERHNGNLFSHQSFFEHNADFVKSVFDQMNFQQIYVACDSSIFIDLINQRIDSEKVFYHIYDRGDSNQDWTQKNRPITDEIKNMFIDFINLKQCHHSIISTSNVAFGLLCHNKDMSFEIFPMLKELHGM